MRIGVAVMPPPLARLLVAIVLLSVTHPYGINGVSCSMITG